MCIPLRERVICGYHEQDRACREAATVVIKISGRDVGLCDRHSRPEFHPPDLHKKLPGRLSRAVRKGAAR